MADKQRRQQQSSSASLLSEQWRKLQGEFRLAEESLASREKEVESKEREVEAVLTRIEGLEEEVVLQKKKVALQEKELGEKLKEVEQSREEIELTRREMSESRLVLEEREKEVDQRREEMDLKEKEVREEFWTLEKTMKTNKDFLTKRAVELSNERKELASKKKELDEGFEKVEVMKKEVGERFANVESREKELKEFELKEKGIEERVRMVQLKEKQVNESSREVESMREEAKLRKKELDERFRELERREGIFMESHKGLAVIEKEVDGRFRVVILKEKELAERVRAAESKEKEANERLELMEKELSDKFGAVELKEKEVNEGFRALELKKRELIEGFQRLKLKEKEVEEYLEVVRLRENKMNGSVEILDLRVKQIEEYAKGIELKHRQVVKLKEKQLNDGLEALEVKAKDLEDCCKVMELEEKKFEGLVAMEKELNIRHSALDLREQSIDERCRAQESKEMHLEEQMQCLEAKEKRINERCQSLEAKERGLKEGFQVVKLIEKQIEEKYREVELKKKEIDDRYDAIEVKEKQVRRRHRVLDLREQNIIELKEKPPSSSIELLEKQYCDSDTEMDLANVTPSSDLVVYDNRNSGENREIDRLCLAMDGKALQMFLNERVDKQESMRDELCNALKLSKDPAKLVLSAIDGADDASATRKSCVLLLELVMNINPIPSEALIKEAVKVANEWREKMQIAGESETLVLGFLLLLVAYNLWPNFKINELQRLYKMVDQHTLAPQLWLRLGFSEAKDENSLDKLQTGEILSDTFLQTSAVASSSIRSSDDIQLMCREMDAKGLGSYLIQHVNHYDMLNDKILDSLRLALDPAKLVLNVIQCLHVLKLEDVSVSNFAASCINLLIQLMKLRADISSNVKNEARNFVDVWRLLLKQSKIPLENFGFLQFLASFKLAETIDTEELLSRFVTLCEESEVYDQISYLCDALGLRRKMEDVIRSLILKDKQLQAVRYICVLKMEHTVPAAPLLKAHLQKTQTQVKEILKADSRTAQDDAANVELPVLKEILKCISDFKLESSFSPDSLVLRIEQLEKEREGRKSTAKLPTIKRCSDIKKEKVKAEPSDSPLTSPHTQFENKRPVNSLVSPREEKRPRVHHTQARPHVYPVWHHQYLPPMRWSDHLLAPRPMYGVPFNTRTGEYGVPGMYHVGNSTSVYVAGNQVYTTRDNDSITLHGNGYRR